MNSEKKLAMMISILEASIHREQVEAAVNRQYFMHLMDKHRLVLAALLIPAFLIGWKEGRKGRAHLIKAAKRYVRLVLVGALTYIKPKLSAG